MYKTVDYSMEEKEKTRFEEDILSSETFPELMIRMNSSGVFVPEKTVFESLLRKLLFSGYRDNVDIPIWIVEIQNKVSGLVSDAISGGTVQDLPFLLVETVEKAILSFSRSENKWYLQRGLVSLMSSTERKFPGMLKTVATQKGNLLNTLIFELKIFDIFEAILMMSDSRHNFAGDVEREISSIIQDRYASKLVSFMISGLGFDPEEKSPGGKSLSEIVSKETLETWKKTLDSSDYI